MDRPFDQSDKPNGDFRVKNGAKIPLQISRNVGLVIQVLVVIRKHVRHSRGGPIIYLSRMISHPSALPLYFLV